MDEDKTIDWWGKYRTFIDVMNDIHELLVVDAYKEGQPVKAEHLEDLKEHVDGLEDEDCISTENAHVILNLVEKGKFAGAQGFCEGLWMQGLVNTFPTN